MKTGLERYSALEGLHVADAMHHGLVSCPVDAYLSTVARMMVTHRVHAILVLAHGENQLPGGAVWGIISDVDLLEAARTCDLEDVSALSIARSAIVTVRPRDELRRAAELMLERGSAHVIVVDPCSARPIGMLSTLDVARALGGFPERHPLRM